MSFGSGGFGGFGQQNQNQSSGFGGFGSNTNTNTGGFGASNTNNAFGSNTPAGGGLFGNTSSGFGGSGGFGSTSNNAFGAKPAFGSTTTAGGGLFGSSTATAGGTGFGSTGFGANTASTSTPFGGGGSLFGGNKPAGFGSTATTGTGTSLFGAGGSFGSSSTPAFGATNNPGIGANVGDPPGTAQVPFAATNEKEANNTSQTNSFQNILFMEPYKKWSGDELRLADYNQGRRHGNSSGAGAFGVSSGFGSTGFGSNTQNTGFGSSNTGTGLFGSSQPAAASTGFGGTTATPGTGGFGSSGGLFGQNKPATGGLFGGTSQPAQTGGLFGSSNTGFGANTTNTAGGFGAANTNTGTGGLFGAQTATQNKPSGFSFGSTANTGSGFGNTANTGGFGANASAGTGTGLFGATNQASTTTNTGGGLFGNTNQQQQQGTTGFGGGGGFGTQNQQTGGGLFGSQQKPAGTGLFGSTTAGQTGGGGLFGSNTNTATPFGASTTNQSGGGLFGAKPAATGTGLFGSTGTGQTGTTGGGLFSGLGANNQTQQQPAQNTLFGGSTQNQQKPSLFGQPAQSTGTGLFGGQNQQQGGIFGGSTIQQPQQTGLTGSIFNTSQNSQAPQSLTASINDVSAYGTPSLFSNLGTGEVQNPGPLATPLSSKTNKPKKGSVLPLWKLNPGSATKFVTPSKRGYGFSYSTYGSPSTPSSVSSTPGALSQSLLTGSIGRGLSKSISTSSLRRSFNVDDTILNPGSFSSSSGPRYGSVGSVKKLTIDRSMRTDLFSTPNKEKPGQDLVNGGSRKLTKRVSFDTSNVDAIEDGRRNETPTSETDAQDLGYLRPSSGNTNGVNGTKSRPLDAAQEMEQVKGKELAIVHEEESPAPTPRIVEPSGDKEPGEYWMHPSKEEIQSMNRVQRSQVSDFTVGRKNVGQIRFKVPVDLTNIDPDELFGGIINLQTRSATVYPNPAKKPPVGKGLNVPAEISLEQSWPRGRDKKTPVSDKAGHRLIKHVERLKRIENTTFIDYNKDTGVWVFSVEHFTTYGLDYDEEETEGELVGDSLAVKEPVSVQSQTTINEEIVSPEVDPDDTFEFRHKRRALPGAFDRSEAVSDDEEDMADATQESFLSDRSAGSASNAVVLGKDENMDEEYAMSEDQDASAYLRYHPAAEHDIDSQYLGSLAEYQETPGGVMRARMRAVKESNTPRKVEVTDGDDWMDMLQKTISPQKRDRAALKSLDIADSHEQLQQSTRGDMPMARSRIVSDGRGFATSIDLMNSLFEKARSPVKTVQAPAPSKGFKWPYKRQNKDTAEDEANMDPKDRAFHDCLRPSWGGDGTLVLSTTPKVLTRSSRRTVEKEGLMSLTKLNIVSENRDVRFAKFSNESAAKALSNHIAMTKFTSSGGVPEASLDPVPNLKAFFHEQDMQNPGNAHEKLVWELASILFDDVRAEAGLQSSHNEESQLRRAALSNFWKGLVEEASSRSIGMARSPEEKAVASLSGHRVADACKHLLDGKNFRLATLVSLIGTSDLTKKDMREQVREWHEANVLSEFSEPLRAIYELLGGNVCICEGKKGAMENRMESFVISERFGLDWKQAFGLRLWYAISANDDVASAVRLFEEDVEQDKEARPVTWFAEQGIPALWEDPDKATREDLLWGLLCLFADQDIDLEHVLRPENSQLSPLDFRLSWQLGRALLSTHKVSFSDNGAEKADAATLSFAAQLTNEGSWLEAVFVLLHLSDPASRVKAIQDHLCHHAGQLGTEQSESFITLTQTFKIPAAWIWQAKALYMRSIKKDPSAEVHCLLRASAFAEAHKTFAKQVAPAAIIERDYEGLFGILKQFEGHENSIPDWNLGGEIYRDFLQLVHHRKKGTQAPPSVLEDLMSGLPAMHEAADSTDIIEVAAVADMANFTAKAVVDIAKRGDMQLSNVLGLPLTEDGYLKYSTELAFAYYRDIMVGRS
ncbi:Nuclear protein 96-domain-containing protein [Pleurostoma richardsiae]|uniref:Nuclear protein 96-domain-containing protein n=1 Tax=Pleurostoma richardsiae TaxID=41990 RepID=A0AA38S876_9PEZI|nr:Nuclear protein 96-domain-containing protein [Pleurostoma richardsiae]